MMRRLVIPVLILLVIPALTMNASSEKGPAVFEIPVVDGCFTENAGQWDEAVQFLGEAPFGHIALSDDGMFYNLVPGEDTGHVLELSFQGSRGCEWIGSGDIDNSKNYILGNDPERWAFSVRSFGMVSTEHLWEGIDLTYMITSEGPKYEFHISPGSKVSDIMVHVDGSSRLSIQDNSLVMEVDGIGSVIDDGLLIYEQGGKVLDGNFILYDDRTYGFEVDGWNGDLPLIIDPVLNSTFLGGSSHDEGTGIVYQGGSVYVASYSMSTNFPTSSGVYSTSNAGASDIVITKMNEHLSKVIYSTYLGGTSNEVPWALRVDSNGCAYVTGYTASSDFPTSSNPLQSNYAGSSDIFITKMDQNGTSLVYSTFYGGSGSDWGDSMDIDSSGNVYVTGHTSSDDFPCTDDAYIKNSTEFSTDGFAMRVNPAGSKVLYATYINGEDGTTWCSDVDADDDGNAFIVGRTTSRNFTVTNGSFDTNYSGNSDMFVLKLLPNGTDVVWSTFVGGSGYESGDEIHLLSNGDLFIGGVTMSTDLSLSSNAFSQNLSGSSDLLLLTLNASGDKLGFMTYLGGGSFETIEDLIEDSEGQLYCTGGTRSGDFPMSPDAYDNTHGSTTRFDVYLSRLSRNGTNLLYSTFIGSTAHEYGSSIHLDDEDVVYLTGRTESTGFPTTTGAIDTTHNGLGEVFATKFSIKDVPGMPINLTGKLSVGSIELDWELPSTDGGEPILGYKVIRSEDGGPLMIIDDEVGDPGYNDTSITFGSTYKYQVIAFNRIGPSKPSSAITVEDEIPPVIGLDMSPTSASPLEEITFITRASDDLWLDKVEIEYRYGEGDTEIEELLGPGGLDYQLDHRVLDTSENIHYRFTATDLYENKATTEWSTVMVSGDPRPIFGVDGSDEFAFTGDAFTATIEVFDNVEVQNCMIEYNFPGSYSRNISMDKTGENGWTYSFDAPQDSLSSLEYSFHAVDTNENWRTSQKRTVEVKDNDPPVVKQDSTPESCVAGEGLLFMVEIEDNIRVSEVFVDIIYENGVQVNVSLESHIGSYFMKDHETDTSCTSLEYRITALDRAGNQVTDEWKEVKLTDEIPPEFVDFKIPKSVSTGSNAELGLNATDNIDIESVTARYRFGDTGIEHLCDMTGSDGAFSCSISVPSDRTDEMYVSFIMEDGSGLSSESEEFVIKVLDDTAPSIEPIDEITASEGDLISVNLMVDDNVGISRVIWSGIDAVNGAMSWTGQLPAGSYNVTVTVKDPSGNHAVITFSIDVVAGSEDQDGDGIPDEYEIDNGMDPYDPSDSSIDLDGDGLSALIEFTLGTDPSLVDSDGDLIPDGWEHEHGLDPMVDNSLTDSDNDGRNDRLEHLQSTDPLIQDKAPVKDGEESSSLWVIILVLDLLVLCVIIAMAVLLALGRKKSGKIKQPIMDPSQVIKDPEQTDELDDLFNSSQNDQDPKENAGSDQNGMMPGT